MSVLTAHNYTKEQMNIDDNDEVFMIENIVNIVSETDWYKENIKHKEIIEKLEAQVKRLEQGEYQLTDHIKAIEAVAVDYEKWSESGGAERIAQLEKENRTKYTNEFIEDLLGNEGFDDYEDGHEFDFEEWIHDHKEYIDEQHSDLVEENIDLKFQHKEEIAELKKENEMLKDTKGMFEDMFEEMPKLTDNGDADCKAILKNYDELIKAKDEFLRDLDKWTDAFDEEPHEVQYTIETQGEKIDELVAEVEDLKKENEKLKDQVYELSHNCNCDNCDEKCGEDDAIFIFEHKSFKCPTYTFCESCGNDLHEEMKKDGWFRDDDEEEPIIPETEDDGGLDAEEMKNELHALNEKFNKKSKHIKVSFEEDDDLDAEGWNSNCDTECKKHYVAMARAREYLKSDL